MNENTPNTSPAPQSKTGQNTTAEKSPIDASSLWMNYCFACEAYLQLCQANAIPSALLYPFLYFYRHGKNKIYTTCRYSYGADKSSNRFTKTGVPFFLKNICHLPFIDSHEADELFSSLFNLIADYPYDHAAITLEHLRKFAPWAATILGQNNFFILSKEGKLFFRNEDRNIYSVLDLPSLTVIGESASQIPVRFLKDYLLELTRQYKLAPDKAPQIQHSKQSDCDDITQFPHSLYFQNDPYSYLYFIQYDSARNQFKKSKMLNSYAFVSFQVKTLPCSVLDKNARVPTTIVAFMDMLCGNNLLTIMNQFLIALTEAMLTDGTRFLALHTKAHKKELQSFFSDVLSPTAVKIDFRPHPKAKQRTCLTLTQLAKSTNLRSLFFAQSAGKCTVLVDDVLPSDASLSTLRKLISKKNISLNSDFAPPQHYYNRLCIVCVTDDHKKAEYFQKKFKTKVIDFSYSESATPHDLKFEADDTAWIYSTLIPYGLKLKTLQALDIADPAPFDFPHIPTPPTEEECILNFLDLCHYKKDCLCTTSEVYDSYCQFLAVTHAGRSPSLTKTMFNKKFKKLTKSKFAFKRPHKSRTGPSPYCYVGLKLPEAFPPSVVPVCVPQESLLRQYLEHISKYQIKHDGLQVKVIQTVKE